MNFAQSVKHVIEDEGGYVNHPKDPGGETKYGISKRSYPGLDIKNLSLEDAVNIYRDDFWVENGIDRMPFHLRYQFFDMTVNHGPHLAAKILQRACGVKDDGLIGPKTLKAAESLTNVDLANQRALFFVAIVKNRSTQMVFLDGWMNRCFKVLKRSIYAEGK